jgi:hypothetical protein
MSCGVESLFVKVTREPTVTVMSRGDAPADVIVMVVVLVDPPGGGVGVGVVLVPLSLSPHAAARSAIRRIFER